MAQDYDRTDLPDENQNNFYVDDFGEQMRQDEVLPERGEGLSDDTQSDDSISEDGAFYEQAPGSSLNDSYQMPSDEDLGLGTDEDDYDPLAFRTDEEDAI